MNKTTWIIIVLLCVIGLGSLVVFTKKDSVNVDDIDQSKVIESKDGVIGDQVRGNKNAKVVVIEYADFQCPGCLAAHKNTSRIYANYGDKVAFVFRNFPLTSAHPNALAAATVAEAAGLQGKYWEMNDALFDRRDTWASLASDKRTDAFMSVASQVGLDITKLKDDISNNKEIQTKITTDRALGAKSNVTATPTFFVNGVKMTDDVVSDLLADGGGNKFMDYLDARLKEAGETPPTRQ